MPTKIVLRDISRDTHYKITMAATYNSETIKDFVIRAVKHYIATQSVPSVLLVHPTLAPLDLQSWLMEYPGIQTNVFTAPDGISYTSAELIAIAKGALCDEASAPPLRTDTLRPEEINL